MTSGYGLREYLLEKLLSGDSTPTLLVGDVGVGKSTIVEEAIIDLAKHFGREWYIIRNDVSIPQVKSGSAVLLYVDLIAVDVFELRGIPDKSVSGIFKYQFPPLHAILSRQDIYVAILFDDVDYVRNKSVISALNKILLNKVIFGVERDVPIFLTGNSDYNLNDAILSRIERIEVDVPSVDDWIKYMDEFYDGIWFRPIGEFLKENPAYIGVEKANGRISCPRQWTNLALRLYKLSMISDLTPEKIYRVARGYVVEQHANELFKWLVVSSSNVTGDEVFDEQVFNSLTPTERVFAIEKAVAKYGNDVKELLRIINVLSNVSVEYLFVLLMKLDKKTKQKLVGYLPKEVASLLVKYSALK